MFFLARLLTVKQFGVFTFSMVFANLLVLIVEYGYNIKLSKDTARDKENISKMTSDSVIVKLFLAVIGLIVLSIIKTTTAYLDNSDFNIIIIMSFAAIFNSFANHFMIPFRSIDRFDIESKFVFFNNISIFLGSVIVTYFFRDVLYLALVFCCVKFIFCLVSYLFFQRKFKMKFSRINLWENLRVGLPYAVHVAVGAMYLNVDTLILKKYITTSEIGIYQAGMRAMGAATMLMGLMNTVLLPRFSAMANDKIQLHKIAVFFNRITLLIGFFIAVMITVFSEQLINIVYSSKFISLNKYVWMFALIIFLRYAGNIYGTLLTISDKQKVRTFGVVMTLLFIVFADLYVIPNYGIYGALSVLLIAHILLNIVYIVFAHREFKTFFILKSKKG